MLAVQPEAHYAVGSEVAVAKMPNTGCYPLGEVGGSGERVPLFSAPGLPMTVLAALLEEAAKVTQ